MDFAKWKFKPKSASSILQALSFKFCQLQFTCFCVSSFLKVPGFVVFRLIQNPPPTIHEVKKINESGAFPATPSVRFFDGTTHQY